MVRDRSQRSPSRLGRRSVRQTRVLGPRSEIRPHVGAVTETVAATSAAGYARECVRRINVANRRPPRGRCRRLELTNRIAAVSVLSIEMAGQL